ncbi:MAG: hypothetical protein QXK37_00890 [Candidatus Woesearchaeota archaeon]
MILKNKILLFSLWQLRLLLICCIAVLLGNISFAATATTSASVANSLPVASSVILNNGSDIVLTANSTTTVQVNATITDNNGCEDITQVTATLYITSVGSGASDNNQTHYSATCVSNGDCSGGGDISETFHCNFSMTWYANPTDSGSANEGDNWTAEVVPYDGEGEGTSDTAIQELLTLTAMSLETTSISFGEISLGGDTADNNENTLIANHGNEQIDVELSGYGSSQGDGYCMVCTSGAVGVSYLEYSLNLFTYGFGTQLASSPTELDLDVAQGSDTTPRPTKSIYYGLGFPVSGISGTCTGTLVITAVSDPLAD